MKVVQLRSKPFFKISVGFSKQRKKPGWRRSSNCVQNALFQLSLSGQNAVSCHHFGWAFAAEKAGFTKVVQSRSKRVLLNFPIGGKRKNSEKTAFSKQRKKPGSNFTISVSCHHFGWAFPSSGKSRVDEGRPIAFKTLIGAKRKNSLGIEF